MSEFTARKHALMRVRLVLRMRYASFPCPAKFVVLVDANKISGQAYGFQDLEDLILFKLRLVLNYYPLSKEHGSYTFVYTTKEEWVDETHQGNYEARYGHKRLRAVRSDRKDEVRAGRQ